jgi:hypothetical protein
MLVGDVPLTPGLASSKPLKSGGSIASTPFKGAAISEENGEGSESSAKLDDTGKPDGEFSEFQLAQRNP